jgi:hydroxypyruvate isomerase
MTLKPAISRRAMLGTAAGAAGLALTQRAGHTEGKDMSKPISGRLKQSVCKWCYGSLSLDELSAAAADIGLGSVELLGPGEWDVVKAHGLTCAMASGPGPIHQGWNREEHHEELLTKGDEMLRQIAAAGLPNMIVFSGNRRRLDDAQGLKNCAKGLKQLTPLAEELGVTICMELLNSKRDHRDYQCDHTPWGAELVQAVGSPRFKLLYDIYHMQIMEGDVIQTIRDFHDHIAHYHTGGVPGRNEIDETQELNYRRIAEAILETGFEGYFGQEFIPKGDDPIASLRAAAHLCDV